MEVVIVMSRAPIPNETKTRLMPHLTGEQCAELHKSFLRDVFGLLDEVKEERKEKKGFKNMDIILSYTPNSKLSEFDDIEKIKSKEVEAIPQIDGDIGMRMSEVMRKMFERGYSKVILIGSDIPAIQKEDIEISFTELEDNDVVFGKTEDGGYYLVGMSSYTPEVFEIDENLWGGESVFESTLEKLRRLKKSVGFTNTRYDIDYIEDLIKYKKKEIRKTETLKYIEKLGIEKCSKTDY